MALGFPSYTVLRHLLQSLLPTLLQQISFYISIYIVKPRPIVNLAKSLSAEVLVQGVEPSSVGDESAIPPSAAALRSVSLSITFILRSPSFVVVHPLVWHPCFVRWSPTNLWTRSRLCGGGLLSLRREDGGNVLGVWYPLKLEGLLDWAKCTCSRSSQCGLGSFLSECGGGGRLEVFWLGTKRVPLHELNFLSSLVFRPSSSDTIFPSSTLTYLKEKKN